MAKHHRLLTELTFGGPRFDDHGFDLSALRELTAYRDLLVETAKELWRERNPGRERLPKGFEEGIVLKFYKLGVGSTVVPVQRIIEVDDEQMPLEVQDDVELAAELIDLSLAAAARNAPPPDRLPASVVPLFDEWGKTLLPGESIASRANGRPQAAVHDATTRERIRQWVEKTYHDAVDLVGEVRAADLDSGRFFLRTDEGTRVQGCIDETHEEEITRALREHDTCRLRVVGRGEYLVRDGSLKRIVAVDCIELRPVHEAPPESDERPLWEIVVEIGQQVDEAEWAKVPSDLAQNMNHYLYGAEKEQ